MDHNLPARIDAASSLAELAELTTELLGKKSDLAQRKQRLGQLAPEERRAEGQRLNEEREAIEAALAARRTSLQEAERAARYEAERLDLTEVVPGLRRGHLHLVTQTIEELEDTFVGMGFTVSEGPVVETDWYNFEALNFPSGHPARNM